MRRVALAVACVLLLPVAASAATLTATLSGDGASGFAVVDIANQTVSYQIITSGLSSPSSAVITDGGSSLDLGATFVAGTAVGSVSDAMAADIAADPAAYDVEVSDGATTISGSLGGSPAAPVTLYIPVVAATSGQGGALFRTDVRLVNMSGGMASVDLMYHPSDGSGAIMSSVTVADGAQLVLDDVVADELGTEGRGGLVIGADRDISAMARIYNDQRPAGEGTFGQFVQGVAMDEARISGLIPFLSNRAVSSGEDFRSNIGWLNPNGEDAVITFNAYDSDGTSLGDAVQRTAVSLTQGQANVGDLWSGLADYGDHYLTFEATVPVFVYGAVADNVSSDGIYIPAVPLG